MILKRFYDEQLAQASYLVGCAATGEALVVDANRDIEQYLEAAQSLNLRITHVSETHIHADYVSGSRELAQRTGAQLYLSGAGGASWQYPWAGDAGARVVHDGDRFQVGNIRIDVVHTPGHTPEHIIFLVTDGAVADRPMGALTGDFVFVGDVGRPDLLERAVGVAGTMENAARDLFRSLQRFRQHDEWLQIWPGHGAGSACGKGLSAVPTSTLGYELRYNWAFGHDREDAFVEAVLAGQPEAPPYFAQMKRINQSGPPLRPAHAPPEIDVHALPGAIHRKELIIDIRPAAAYAAGHVPGTINIPLNASFLTWAGWLLPYDRDFSLLSDDDGPRIAQALDWLGLIGLDSVSGYYGANALRAWEQAGRPLAITPAVKRDAVVAWSATGAATIIDVRNQAEWNAGHIPGALHIPLGELQARVAEVPAGHRVVVHCQAGTRSAIACSMLEAAGVLCYNYSAGYADWARAGLSVVTESDPRAKQELLAVG